MSQLSKVDYKKFILPVVVGLIIWFASPIKPASVSMAGWHILAIFVATILGCITQPLPIAGVSLIGITLTILFGIVPLDDAMLAFGNGTVWMIAMAYILSRGFIKTGLGKRIGLTFVKLFGKRTLGLAYALMGVDLVLSPATPSNTARSGGIVLPIIDSIADSFGSHANDGTGRKIGSFLVYTAFHGNVIDSAIFLTAMAPNLVSVALATAFHVHITWFSWLAASIVPGILSFLIVPFIIYKMYPPEIKDTPNAKQWAEDELAKMGKMSLAEKLMAGIFVIALVLWILSSFIGMEATLVAFIAVSLLLLTGVITINDVLNEKGAWNVVVWFSILIFMANELTKLGFIPWLSHTIATSLHGLSWGLVLAILCVFYFYIHYLFASGTAHVSAMYGALLGVAIAAGAPATMSALMLGYTASLFSSTTHYASGSASAMFGSGFIDQKDWWKMNFILGIVYLIIWIGFGSLWMKIIGLW